MYTRKETTPTTSFLGIIEQDAVDWGSNQNSTACLLNNGDHVVGDFTGSAFWVPSAVQVVSDQQAVHGETGILWHVACRLEKKKKGSDLFWRNDLKAPTALQLNPTVGAKDVGEDSPEVFVVRQLINHFCQAAGCHFEEERQIFGQASVDEELSQGNGAELQHC